MTYTNDLKAQHEENIEALWQEYFDQLESKHQDDAYDAVVEDQLTQEL